MQCLCHLPPRRRKQQSVAAPQNHLRRYRHIPHLRRVFIPAEPCYTSRWGVSPSSLPPLRCGSSWVHRIVLIFILLNFLLRFLERGESCSFSPCLYLFAFLGLSHYSFFSYILFINFLWEGIRLVAFHFLWIVFSVLLLVLSCIVSLVFCCSNCSSVVSVF